MTERPLSERYPKGHARIVAALHRYNVGPDWTRAECVDLIREVERMRAAGLDYLRAERVLRAHEVRCVDSPCTHCDHLGDVLLDAEGEFRRELTPAAAFTQLRSRCGECGGLLADDLRCIDCQTQHGAKTEADR